MSKVKISIVGDIMCEPLLIKAARKGDSYDFSHVFHGVKETFAQSDYVIGNLETPLAGEKAHYCREFFSFNAPDEFAKAIRESGINLVTTANNHCLDRGKAGLRRTLEVLDQAGLVHCGTNRNNDDRRITYFDCVGTSVAVVSATYGTNSTRNGVLLEDDEKCLVNLLCSQKRSIRKTGDRNTRRRITLEKVIYKGISILGKNNWKIEQINKIFGTGKADVYADDNLDIEAVDPYIDRIILDLQEARATAKFVIFYPHLGGQFNTTPGEFTRYVLGRVAASGYCDLIVASHPHVVQKAEILHGVPCFYSLGNFSMSPNSYYIPGDANTNMGLIVNAYLENGQLRSVTFNILKISENTKEMMEVTVLDGIPTKQGKEIYRTVTGKEFSSNESLNGEYTFWVAE